MKHWFLPPRGLCAFGGGPLAGDCMRIAYVDETGHSSKEKIAVVGGVLIDQDKQYHGLADAIARLKQEVPEPFREGFFFHATDLFYGGKYRHVWSDEERWSLLEKLISIPRMLKAPIVFGSFVKPAGIPNSFADSTVVHAIAFGQCLRAIDKFLCENAPSEYALIIAEDRDGAQKALREIHKLYENVEKFEKVLSPDMQRGLPISRVKYPPAFAKKDEEILLQIADACAWIWQRFLNDADKNERFMQALFGNFAHPIELGQLRKFGSTECAFWWPDDYQETAYWLGFSTEQAS